MTEPYIPADFKASLDAEIARLTNEIYKLRALADKADVLGPLYEEVVECFGPATMQWLNTPARALGGKTPIQAMLDEQHEAVRMLVGAVVYGTYL